MKKFYLLSALLLSFGLSASAQIDTKNDKWYVGIGGGFHTTFMRFSDINEKMYPTNKNLHSGVFALFGQYEFGKEKHFAVRPEIALLRRGGKLTEIGKKYGWDSDVEDARYELKARYWDIRVPVMYQFMDANSVIRPYVYVAPVLGFATRGTINLHSDYKDGSYEGYELELSKANMASSYFAGMIGVGAKYHFNVSHNTWFLALEAAYEIGFTNTYGGKEKDGTAKVNHDWSNSSFALEGSRKFSGIEIMATLGVPINAFKKKAVAEPAPAPVVTRVEEPVVVVEEKEKPCYTLEEINDMMVRGERVEGKTICAVDAISFDFGKSTIKRESYDYLNQLASTLIRTNAKIEVKGHTDNVGSEEFNMNLSKERARAVMTYLVSRGVNKSKLSYSYYGMSRPLTTNDTEEGRTMNRRVEFEILK